MMRIIIILILTIGVSACGFKPMLAKNSEGSHILDNIKISSIEGKDKSRTKRIILESFDTPSNIDQLYILDIRVKYELSSMAILKDSQSTRSRVKATLDYTLKDAETRKVIDSSNVFIYGSYNVASSEFTNYISERHVGDTLLKELCEELKGRLRLVLSSKVKSDENTP
jgi:hypothetical protein